MLSGSIAGVCGVLAELIQCVMVVSDFSLTAGMYTECGHSGILVAKCRAAGEVWGGEDLLVHQGRNLVLGDVSAGGP